MLLMIVYYHYTRCQFTSVKPLADISLDVLTWHGERRYQYHCVKTFYYKLLCVGWVRIWSSATQLYSALYSSSRLWLYICRRRNCSTCLEAKDECVWCDSTQTCDQFAPYTVANSYGQCKAWRESFLQQGESMVTSVACTGCRAAE